MSMNNFSSFRRWIAVKVLMVEFYLPESVYTLELAKELRHEHNVDLTIFCRENAGAELDGVKWKRDFYAGGKKKFKAIFEYGRSLLRLRREISCGHYDVVHVQMFKNAKYEIPLYCRAKKHCGFLVHTVHNLLPHEATAEDRELYQRFYETCDLLIVHNEHCKKLLMEEHKISEKKICVTPHGAYTQVHAGAQAGRVHPDGKKHFVQFGIMRKYKGIDILLEAVSKIPEEKREKLQIVIAGAQFQAMDPTDYQALADRLGVSDCVTIRTGHVPDQELDELFGNSDFALFPYRNIYGSGALLMAYSYGLPVIASDIPVFREETKDGETGILFASENPEALGKAILEAMEWSQTRYEECQERIGDLVKETYSWKRSAKILAEAYQRQWEKMKKRVDR